MPRYDIAQRAQTVLTVSVLLAAYALVAPSPATAQADAESAPAFLLRDDSTRSLIQLGRTMAASARLREADAVFYRAARRSDGAPAAYMNLVTTGLVQVMLDDDEAAYDVFFARSDSLRELLDDERDSPARTHLEAENDLYRSMVWAKRGRYALAAMAAVSAYRGLDGVPQDDPVYGEALKGLGMINTAVGAMPRMYRRFLSLFGFPTSMELGLDQLERTVDEGRVGREEALIFLAELDSFGLPSRVDAARTLRRLHAETGSSPVYALLLADVLLRRRDVAEADSVLTAAHALMNGDDAVYYVEYIDYFLGEIRFMQAKWDEAVTLLSSYVDRHAGPALKTDARIRLGLAHEMAGNRAQAERYYKAIGSDRQYDTDAAWTRQARLRLDRPMDDADRDLLRAQNAFDRSDLPVAEALVRALLARDGLRPEQRGEAWYRLGRILDESDRDEEATAWYDLASAEPGDPRAKWAPFSLYHRGLIDEQAGRVDEARRRFEAVTSYEPSYDFGGMLERRAHHARRRLSR